MCCVYLKDYQKAIEHFQAAIALSPQTVSFIQLGRVYLSMGSVEDAIDVYKRAVKYVKSVFLMLYQVQSKLKVSFFPVLILKSCEWGLGYEAIGPCNIEL